MIVFTIFRLNRNRTRYDNVDDLKIKIGFGEGGWGGWGRIGDEGWFDIGHGDKSLHIGS